RSQPSPVVRSGGQRPPAPKTGLGAAGGILGVQSKSTDKSIRIYNGRSHYNEWVFVVQPLIQAPGTGARGDLVPGQRLGGPGRPAVARSHRSGAADVAPRPPSGPAGAAPSDGRPLAAPSE